jgi:hypothetical protein
MISELQRVWQRGTASECLRAAVGSVNASANAGQQSV